MADEFLQSFSTVHDRIGQLGKSALIGEQQTNRRNLMAGMQELGQMSQQTGQPISLEQLRDQYARWGTPQDIERIDTKIFNRDAEAFKATAKVLLNQANLAYQTQNFEALKEIENQFKNNPFADRFMDVQSLQFSPLGEIKYTSTKNMQMLDSAGNPRDIAKGDDITVNLEGRVTNVNSKNRLAIEGALQKERIKQQNKSNGNDLTGSQRFQQVKWADTVIRGGQTFDGTTFVGLDKKKDRNELIQEARKALTPTAKTNAPVGYQQIVDFLKTKGISESEVLGQSSSVQNIQQPNPQAQTPIANEKQPIGKANLPDGQQTLPNGKKVIIKGGLVYASD